jgi:hypothetical protein
MTESDTFFDTNKPQFSPKVIDDFSDGYLEHFRT